MPIPIHFAVVTGDDAVLGGEDMKVFVQWYVQKDGYMPRFQRDTYLVTAGFPSKLWVQPPMYSLRYRIGYLTGVAFDAEWQTVPMPGAASVERPPLETVTRPQKIDHE